MQGKVGRNLNRGKCVCVGGASHFELVEPVPGDDLPGDHEEENL